jgi:hypothetical protein
MYFNLLRFAGSDSLAEWCSPLRKSWLVDKPTLDLCEATERSSSRTDCVWLSVDGICNSAVLAKSPAEGFHHVGTKITLPKLGSFSPDKLGNT